MGIEVGDRVAYVGGGEYIVTGVGSGLVALNNTCIGGMVSYFQAPTGDVTMVSRGEFSVQGGYLVRSSD